MRATIFTICVLAAGAGAAGWNASAQAQQTAGAPEIRQINDIAYVSGGIGSDQAAAMRALAGRFKLRLSFVDSADGSYLSDVTVTVFNAKREIVLLTLAEGPFLYLRMVPGEYRLVIRYGGVIECRSVKIKAGGAGIDMILRMPEVPTGALHMSSS